MNLLIKLTEDAEFFSRTLRAEFKGFIPCLLNKLSSAFIPYPSLDDSWGDKLVAVLISSKYNNIEQDKWISVKRRVVSLEESWNQCIDDLV